MMKDDCKEERILEMVLKQGKEIRKGETVGTKALRHKKGSME